MTRGILLIALGHEYYYEMAVNLAASIKHNEPDLQIAIINDGSFLIDSALFDHSIIAPYESYTTPDIRMEYIKSKTWIYELSPFDETIFLDVDMVMLLNRNITALFDELKDVNWTICNTGPAEESIWANIDKINSIYKNPMWNYHSEFIYFKKSEDAELYFNEVREVYETEDVKSLEAVKFSGGRMADELAFQIASMKLDAYPHKENFTPTFWFGRDRKTSFHAPHQLSDEYFFYSIGGHRLPTHVVNHYNILASYYSKKMSLQSFYKAFNKKSFLPERKNI